ncbi:MAG: hypothetical protein ACR2GX_02045 [Candidatus Dormibacteria bacterium]
MSATNAVATQPSLSQLDVIAGLAPILPHRAQGTRTLGMELRPAAVAGRIQTIALRGRAVLPIAPRISGQPAAAPTDRATPVASSRPAPPLVHRGRFRPGLDVQIAQFWARHAQRHAEKALGGPKVAVDSGNPTTVPIASESKPQAQRNVGQGLAGGAAQPPPTALLVLAANLAAVAEPGAKRNPRNREITQPLPTLSSRAPGGPGLGR